MMIQNTTQNTGSWDTDQIVYVCAVDPQSTGRGEGEGLVLAPSHEER